MYVFSITISYNNHKQTALALLKIGLFENDQHFVAFYLQLFALDVVPYPLMPFSSYPAFLFLRKIV